MDAHVLASTLRPRLPDVDEGRFGRLFPDLDPEPSDERSLLALGAAGGPLEAVSELPGEADNPRIAAGWAFFGQFVAHDITHDRAPLQRHEDTATLRNYRSPRLDLECVYGAGPVGQPYLYDLDDGDKLLVPSGDDVPRNHQGRGLVADARNDTHLFISQLHLAFLRFHNRIVDHLRSRGVRGELVLAEAQRLARWHYQWVVANEYLPLVVGDELLADLEANGPRVCRFGGRPFIPVEFSDGAYRFGHSQVRSSYAVNAGAREVALFPELVGSRPVTPEWVVDWAELFACPGRAAPQPSRRIGARLAGPLLRLPERLVGETEPSLAARDLERGRSVDLPSGEAVAHALGVVPCTQGELGLEGVSWSGETPLWLYVLLEAERQQDGLRLGEVGGRIVAEVLLGLLDADPGSYRRAAPGWRPELPAADPGRFTLADLLAFGGVLPAP
jgi:Animal haem peroxidase